MPGISVAVSFDLNVTLTLKGLKYSHLSINETAVGGES